MISQSQKLNTKLFDSDVELVPIRKGFGEGLLEAGEKNPNVVGLCADLTESTQMHFFANKFPERFVQVGVAEQNLVTVASGMAAMGKIPFTSSYAMFSPGRNWEQIRTTACYNDRPVKIVGSHAGVSVGPDGGTHQATEDIALMRVLPNMVVIAPCDSIEAKKATLALVDNGKPSYLRLARDKTPVITTEESPFEIGKANVLWSSGSVAVGPLLCSGPTATGPRVAIIACGSLVHNALVAARKLQEEGIGSIVVNNHTIKPLDGATILDVAKQTGVVVTVEEHQIAGGMGSTVAEFLAQNYPVPIEFVGIEDRYGQSGLPTQLLEHYHMDTPSIILAVKKVLSRKQ